MLVAIRDLRARADLNGRRGRVVGWSGDRFVVDVCSKRYTLRPSNIVPVDEVASLADALRKSVVVRLSAGGEIEAFGFWLDPTLMDSVVGAPIERVDTWHTYKSKTCGPAPLYNVEAIEVHGPHDTRMVFVLASETPCSESVALVVEVAWADDFVARIHAPAIERLVRPSVPELRDKLARVVDGSCDQTVSVVMRADVDDA